MSKRKKKKVICEVEMPPQGCPDLFPHEECENPTIHLYEVGSISCEGVISGRVLCDYRPVPGVVVNLTSTFSGLVFSDAMPVTDSTGRFSTTVTVPEGTPITPGVRITASAVVNGIAISDTLYVRVDCLYCKNPILTLNPISGVVGCKGTKLSGRLVCDGSVIANAAISFTITSSSNLVKVTPNPAITQGDGTYSATLLPFTGINETITVTASVKIGGKEVFSETQQITVQCIKCKNPKITVKNLKKIDCRAFIYGRLTCDGLPLANVPVKLSGSPILEFNPENPVTDENGEFTSVVTVEEGTSLQKAFYTAEAVVDGKTVSVTDKVKAGCVKCTDPKITVKNVKKIDCRAFIYGRLTCDGRPLNNVLVNLSGSSILEFHPENSVTDQNGGFTSVVTVEEGTPLQEAFYTAEAVVDGKTVSVTDKVKAGCVKCTNPKITVKNVKKIDCRAVINGRLTCDGLPLTNVPVKLAGSSILAFHPENPVTDENGEFTSAVTVEEGTPLQEAFYTAEAVVDGRTVSVTNKVKAGCVICKKPELSLKVPKNIGCEGAKLTGCLTCDGVPVPNAEIFFDIEASSPTAIHAVPNPAITKEDGTYSTHLLPSSGVTETITVRAFANIKEAEVSSEIKKIKVDCSCKKPVIEVDNPDKIICAGKMTGCVLCDGKPVPNSEVKFSSDLLNFEVPVVVTNEDGSFSNKVTISPGTPFEKVSYTVHAVVNGVPLSQTEYVWAGCHPDKECALTLEGPKLVKCKEEKVRGRLTCDDKPVENAYIYCIVESPSLEAIKITPNPAITKEDGTYKFSIHPEFGADETIKIRTVAMIEGEIVSSKLALMKIDCPCKKPEIKLEKPKKIKCCEKIQGCVLCDDGTPLPNVEVTLSSPLLTFDPMILMTDENGEFTSKASVPPHTPFEETRFTASAVINGKTISKTVHVRVSC
jgi:uncharacterized GH25 family protein